MIASLSCELLMVLTPGLLCLIRCMTLSNRSIVIVPNFVPLALAVVLLVFLLFVVAELVWHLRVLGFLE